MIPTVFISRCSRDNIYHSLNASIGGLRLSVNAGFNPYFVAFWNK